MSFRDSESLDDLIQDCQRESDAVQIPEDPEQKKSAERNEQAEASQQEQKPLPPKDETRQGAAMTYQKKNAGKSKRRMQGKHGRPLKTDPYGNPIKKKKKDAPLRKSEPVNTVTPADIQKPQVSFMNAIANLEPASRARWSGSTTSQAYDHAVMQSEHEGEDDPYRPKIRKMHDSTRARELRKRRYIAGAMPYQKDSPVEQRQSRPVVYRVKKRNAMHQAQDALKRIPEQLMEQPREDAEPIRYIDKAEHTRIDLSGSGTDAQQTTEIDVRYRNERRVRTDLPKQEKAFQNPEDKQSVRRELLELKTSLSLRVAMLGVLTVLSALITLFDWMPRVPLPDFLSSTASPVSYLAVQILIGLLAIPFSGDLLKNGYMKLLEFRADCDSLAAMSMLSAELSAILILPSPGMLSSGLVSVYISVALLSVWMNAISKKLIVSRALRNFEVLSDGNLKYGIHYVEDERRAETLTRGTMGDFPILTTMQPVEHPNDFLKYTFSTDIGDKFCRIAVPIIFLAAAIFSTVIAVVRAAQVESAVCYGMSVFSLWFSACACTAITLVSNLPMESGTKDYVRNSGLLLGYQSVDDFFDVNAVMIDAVTLFPQGTTKLESIQVVGESRIEEALQYSASLTKHGGSILKDLFSGAILAEEQMILPVENYAYDEGKGISGWIKNKRVLLGTREMMIEHNIEGLPACSKEEELIHGGNEALYLSVSGTVSAMYIIRLEASKMVRRWLSELEQEEIFLLIRSNDALLSQRRIAKMFGFPEHMLKVLPARLEQEYSAETQPLTEANPSMLCAGRLPGFAQTIVGAKRIRAAASTGLLLQAVTACLGMLYVLVFILMGAYEDVSGGILLLYHIICTIVTVLSVRMRET